LVKQKPRETERESNKEHAPAYTSMRWPDA